MNLYLKNWTYQLVSKLNKSIIKYLQVLVPHPGLDLGFLEVFCKIYNFFKKYLLFINCTYLSFERLIYIFTYLFGTLTLGQNRFQDQ